MIWIYDVYSIVANNFFFDCFLYFSICRKQCGQVVLDILKDHPVNDVLENIHQIASTLSMASEDTGKTKFLLFCMKNSMRTHICTSGNQNEHWNAERDSIVTEFGINLKNKNSPHCECHSTHDFDVICY